jgi:hypothetical protein
VLAVVDDEQGGPGRQHLGSHGHRVAAGHFQAERGGQGERNSVPVADRRQCRDGHRIGPTGGGQGQPGLADPARPHHGDQPLGRQDPAQSRDLPVPAEQGPGSTRRPARPRGRRARARGRWHQRGRRGEPGTSLPGGDGAFHLAEPRSGIKAGLLGQTAAGPASLGQRPGRLPCRRQHAHPQPDCVLPQRILGQDSQRQVKHTAGLAGQDRRLDEQVGDLPLQLIQPGGCGSERDDAGQADQWRTAPQLARLPQDIPGCGGMAVHLDRAADSSLRARAASRPSSCSASRYAPCRVRR